jgi:hypothetical protein
MGNLTLKRYSFAFNILSYEQTETLANFTQISCKLLKKSKIYLQFSQANFPKSGLNTPF